MIDNSLLGTEISLFIFRKTFETPVNDKIDCYDVVNNIVSKLPSGQLGKIMADMVSILIQGRNIWSVSLSEIREGENIWLLITLVHNGF